jgi:uncharacterized protein (DUF2267 family)
VVDDVIMTVPLEYEFASQDFTQFLRDARVASDLTSPHQTYTMVQGVLQAFRRRLSVKDALSFANVLPPVVRAVFVADWDVDEPRRPFGDRAAMTREVQALRANHNVAPDTSIQDVARALRKHVDQAAFDRVLATLLEGASQFWAP